MITVVWVEGNVNGFVPTGMGVPTTVFVAPSITETVLPPRFATYIVTVVWVEGNVNWTVIPRVWGPTTVFVAPSITETVLPS